MAAKKGGRKKSGGRKYGKAAGKRVESAMRRKKKGTLKSGQGWKGRQGEEPEASDRHRPFRSAQKGREGSEQERREEERQERRSKAIALTRFPET